MHEVGVSPELTENGRSEWIYRGSSVIHHTSAVKLDETYRTICRRAYCDIVRYYFFRSVGDFRERGARGRRVDESNIG